MNNQLIYGIGLMSGTSLDGLDIVYVRFDKNDLSKFKILLSETIQYNDIWKRRLEYSIHSNKEDIQILDYDYGVFLGNKTQEFINKHNIIDLNLIASHGHTVFHQPEKGITLQVGDGQQISNITNCLVISDFRAQDIRLGGQGAPLVPIGDDLLFKDFDACINIGGFTNISYNSKDQRIAFDICPANIVLNYYSRKLGYEYDNKGLLAFKGVVNEKLLSELNQLKFYRMSPPKSLGLEWVQKFIFPLLDKYQIAPVDILRTFIEHVAHQISLVSKPFETILYSGGGVYNDFLISRIEELTNANIKLPDDEIINFKEALVFALLGLLKSQNKVNCLSSVTGAKKNHSSGEIFKPNNSD
tara:strand:- start:15789 stop:16859 length:1071 start_codon:yes stop_codon:yes gene_type:complete